MDIQSTKIELVKTILAIENTEFIQQIADFVNKEKLERISKEELHSRIDQSESDFHHGRFKTSAELLAKYE